MKKSTLFNERADQLAAEALLGVFAERLQPFNYHIAEAATAAGFYSYDHDISDDDSLV